MFSTVVNSRMAESSGKRRRSQKEISVLSGSEFSPPLPSTSTRSFMRESSRSNPAGQCDVTKQLLRVRSSRWKFPRLAFHHQVRFNSGWKRCHKGTAYGILYTTPPIARTFFCLVSCLVVLRTVPVVLSVFRTVPCSINAGARWLKMKEYLVSGVLRKTFTSRHVPSSFVVVSPGSLRHAPACTTPHYTFTDTPGCTSNIITSGKAPGKRKSPGRFEDWLLGQLQPPLRLL